MTYTIITSKLYPNILYLFTSQEIYISKMRNFITIMFYYLLSIYHNKINRNKKN